MSPYTPRPFPPPSLNGVPLEYILDQLRNLAPHYWNQTESADCTIVIPVPYIHYTDAVASTASHDPSGLGRRVTEPALNFLPRMNIKLHSDFLSAHSHFLRALFAGASPLDLVDTSSSQFNTSSTSPSSGFSSSSASRYDIPSNLLPHVLPSSTSDHPVIFLPVPDPSSIRLLFHWIYFGKTEFIEEALNAGVIEWEGIARNVEYLGLPTEIKLFLGWWYGRWRSHRIRYVRSWNQFPYTAYSFYASACRGEEDEWSDSDTAYSDEDDGEDEDDSYDSDVADDDSVTVEDEDMDVKDHAAPKSKEAEDLPWRGRSRAVKGLSWPLQESEQLQRQLRSDSVTSDVLPR
ncbi:hypothetical protein D9758_000845 [Tetrapyrgos nigripes]|uniref:BTB domain-containing protein n=1 Tax=Tetrapyrgos nigripes TaxID=182062 RepID=A0A8H5GZ84_9AGAR|nr:hypothetical protein D9758_000845 [Tetrapyrgos nigripes]